MRPTILGFSRLVLVSLTALSSAALAAPPKAAGAGDVAAQQAGLSAAGARAGDEALTCDQIKIEMAEAGRDPSLQATSAALGAQAQQQLDEAHQRQKEAMANQA